MRTQRKPVVRTAYGDSNDQSCEGDIPRLDRKLLAVQVTDAEPTY